MLTRPETALRLVRPLSASLFGICSSRFDLADGKDGLVAGHAVDKDARMVARISDTKRGATSV